MPDEPERSPDTADYSDAAQTPPPPPLPPPVERNENPEGDSGQHACRQVTENQNEPPHWTRYVEVVFAGLLVLITATYTYYASRQACAAITAADAARDAAKVATEQMVLEMRPWINLIPGEGVPDSGSIRPGTAIGVQYTISNPGKTAALDLTWESFNALVDPGKFVDPKFVQEDSLWTTKMYPGQSSTPNVTLRGPTIHSSAEDRLWESRKKWEELAIRITYRDSVDVTHPVHVTESCIFVIYSNAANPQCPGHNTQN